MTRKRNSGRFTLMREQVLARYSAKKQPVILELLCQKVEEYTGHKIDVRHLPEGWEASYDAMILFEVALQLLREYHPALARERQKAWSDLEKFRLVHAVECLHAVGYSKRAACRVLAPSDTSLYRRYLKFKKEDPSYVHKKKVNYEDARFQVEHFLKLPLP